MLLLVLAFKLEIGRKYVINYVVQIMPINEVASLVTGVHSNPA